MEATQHNLNIMMLLFESVLPFCLWLRLDISFLQMKRDMYWGGLQITLFTKDCWRIDGLNLVITLSAPCWALPGHGNIIDLRFSYHRAACLLKVFTVPESHHPPVHNASVGWIQGHYTLQRRHTISLRCHFSFVWVPTSPLELLPCRMALALGFPWRQQCWGHVRCSSCHAHTKLLVWGSLPAPQLQLAANAEIHWSVSR